MAFPDYIAPLHQQAMQTFAPPTPHRRHLALEPERRPAASRSHVTLPVLRLWLNIDANSYVTSRLGWGRMLISPPDQRLGAARLRQRLKSRR